MEIVRERNSKHVPRPDRAAANRRTMLYKGTVGLVRDYTGSKQPFALWLYLATAAFSGGSRLVPIVSLSELIPFVDNFAG